MAIRRSSKREYKKKLLKAHNNDVKLRGIHHKVFFVESGWYFPCYSRSQVENFRMPLFLRFLARIFYTFSFTSHAVEGISFPLVMARINSTSDFSLSFVFRWEEKIIQKFQLLVCEVYFQLKISDDNFSWFFYKIYDFFP